MVAQMAHAPYHLVRELDMGNPHVQFDERAQETCDSVTRLCPTLVEATMRSVQLQANHDAALSQWRLEGERARDQAERAECQYRTVEPENRLEARGLETERDNRPRSGTPNRTAPARATSRDSSRPLSLPQANPFRFAKRHRFWA